MKVLLESFKRVMVTICARRGSGSVQNQTGWKVIKLFKIAINLSDENLYKAIFTVAFSIDLPRIVHIGYLTDRKSVV